MNTPSMNNEYHLPMAARRFPIIATDHEVLGIQIAVHLGAAPLMVYDSFVGTLVIARNCQSCTKLRAKPCA